MVHGQIPHDIYGKLHNAKKKCQGVTFTQEEAEELLDGLPHEHHPLRVFIYLHFV